MSCIVTTPAPQALHNDNACGAGVADGLEPAPTSLESAIIAVVGLGPKLSTR